MITLTDKKILALKPQKNRYKRACGNPKNLYIVINPKGKKSFKFLLGNESFDIGEFIFLPDTEYPIFGLKEAREKANQILEKLPKEKKSLSLLKIQEQKQTTIFKYYYDEFINEKDIKPKTLKSIKGRHELYSKPLFNQDIKFLSENPIILQTIINNIEPKNILTDTKERLISDWEKIFDKAIFFRKISHNPAKGLKAHCGKRQKIFHRRAIIDEEILKEFLQDLKNWQPLRSLNSKLALYLHILCATRPTNAISAKWCDINLENSIWTIDEIDMKMKRKHIIPLSKFAVQLLKIQKEFSGDYEFVFPSFDLHKNKIIHLGLNSLNKVIQKNIANGKYKQLVSAHGFRATFASITTKYATQINEKYKMPDLSDVREGALAHKINNNTEEAYVRSIDLISRRNIFDWYADFLNELCPFEFDSLYQNRGNK